MLTEIIMPKAGSEMEEGQIVKWLKKEGDKVEAGEIILEIMTDKVNMEIEAEASGTLLKILKHDGEIVPVITTIAYIGDEGDVIPETASAPVKEEVKEVAKEEVKAQPEEKTTEVKAEAKKELKDGEYDVVVIGAGPAGYYSAIKAAQKGAKVAIAENNKFGGTCLNRGCIPTKTYLQNVEDIERIKASSKRGIILENDNATVDVAKALKFKNSIVKKLTAGVEFLLKSNSVEMFKETAYINSNGNVTLESGKELVCGSIIFAGGSKCVKNIKGSDSSNVIDTDEALDLKEVTQALQTLSQRAEEAQMAAFKALDEENKAFLEENKKATGVNTTESGLQYEVLSEGTGETPKADSTVRVHYTGSLIDGTVFDSSLKRGTPAEFPVNGVIKGWTEALQMMPVGSKWRLTIPHELAYGERGAGASIPPFATLVFEVELLDIL